MNEAVETQGTPNCSTLGQPSHRKWKQRIKDNPCTQGFGGKLSSKAARSGKALELSMMDLNWKLDFQVTAHGWEQTGETSSFSYWYKNSWEQCRAVPGLWWGRVIKPESSERQQGEEENEDRCSEMVWARGNNDFLFLQLYLYQKCIQHHLTEAGSKGEMKGLRLAVTTRQVEQQVCVPTGSIQLFILWRYR